MKEILGRVLKAEEEAKKILEEAQQKADTIRKDTDTEIGEIQANAQEERKRNMEKVIARAREEAESERASILNEAQKQMEVYENLYEKNVNKALDFVIQKLIGE